jgi:hypothetical protein
MQVARAEYATVSELLRHFWGFFNKVRTCGLGQGFVPPRRRS